MICSVEVVLYSLIAKCVISFAITMSLKSHMRSPTVGVFYVFMLGKVFSQF